MLRTLFDTPGVAWVSLQMGESVRELKWIDAPWRPLDPSPDLHDFADTAALIASLDLVIAVDTAVAHLSGALGTPTWILLHHVADWRWLVERDDSPWYPTARLFRQEQPGAWEPVIAQARAELCQWLRHPINSPANPQWLNQLP
jgi:hypothetical protein